MSVSAAIYFTQGVNVSAPGVALIGVAGTPITVANGNNTNVVTWDYTVVDLSSLSSQTLPITQFGSSPTFSFTPDANGAYLFQLTVFDGSGNSATDYRVFQVPETSGRMITSYKASDIAQNFFIGAKQNFRGWAPLMEAYLREVDLLAQASFLDIVTDGNNASVTITDVAHNQLVGFRNLSAARTCVMPTVPDIGQRFAVVNKDGTCSVINTITINPGGTNPIATVGQLTFVFQNPYEGAIFEWTGQIWALLTHVNSSSGSGVNAPGSVITGNQTLGPTNQWNLVAANGQTLTQNSPLPGVPYRYTHAPGGAFGNTFTGAGQVTLAAGTGGFTIVDPQNNFATPTTSVTFRTDGITYVFMLDSGANVFRCIN